MAIKLFRAFGIFGLRGSVRDPDSLKSGGEVTPNLRDEMKGVEKGWDNWPRGFQAEGRTFELWRAHHRINELGVTTGPSLFRCHSSCPSKNSRSPAVHLQWSSGAPSDWEPC
jgi:hypothetical protein